MRTTLQIFIAGVAALVCGVTLLAADAGWYSGDVRCIGMRKDGRPDVILTCTDGTKYSLELRGKSESLHRLILPEGSGKIASVKVKGELKRKTITVSEYQVID